jgi:hypothetical protein
MGPGKIRMGKPQQKLSVLEMRMNMARRLHRRLIGLLQKSVVEQRALLGGPGRAARMGGAGQGAGPIMKPGPMMRRRFLRPRMMRPLGGQGLGMMRGGGPKAG